MFLFPTCQLCIWATFGQFPSNLNLPRITGLDQKKPWKKKYQCKYLFGHVFGENYLKKEINIALYARTHLFSFVIPLILQSVIVSPRACRGQRVSQGYSDSPLESLARCQLIRPQLKEKAPPPTPPLTLRELNQMTLSQTLPVLKQHFSCLGTDR